MTVFDSPELCLRCSAKCCRYFMLEIDTPTCKSDFENIRWYLCHHDTTVYVEKGNHWYLHFQSICRYLTADGRCGIYNKRPTICREHNPSDCEHSSEYSAKMIFTTIDELDEYIEKRYAKDRKTKNIEVKA